MIDVIYHVTMCDQSLMMGYLCCHCGVLRYESRLFSSIIFKVISKILYIALRNERNIFIIFLSSNTTTT